MTQRIQRHPYLAIFDGADPSTSTPQRLTSTTPLQALFLLNDALVHEQAGNFAKRLVAEGATDEERLKRAYELALIRPPAESEIAEALGFVKNVRAHLKANGADAERIDLEAWSAMARAVFRLNEFVYLD